MDFVDILLVKGFKVQDHSNTSIRFWPYKNVRYKFISICLHTRFNYSFLSKSKKDSKDQETIQSSNTPDPGYHMGK